ncbi:Cytoplasmic dynein 1 heavy chain 1, partial [Exaiptasia diaphana]
CAFNSQSFRDILAKVQKAVDELNLHSYSNLPAWVNTLDKQVEMRLSSRLQAGIKSWTDCLRGNKSTKHLDDTDTASLAAHKPGGDPDILQSIHEVCIQNQVLFMRPPVERAREHLVNEMHRWVGIITMLPRIQSSRYQVGVERDESESETTYRNLLAKLPEGPVVLEQAYAAVEERVAKVEEYEHMWLQYQALWDMDIGNVYNRLGEDLSKWMKVLKEIKRSRVTFDTSDTKKVFGPVVVDFAQVQSKVNMKYDTWHKDVLSKFASRLGDGIQEFYGTVSKARGDMEQQTIEGASTSDAVAFITVVQSLKRKLKNWDKNVEMYKEGQRILERQRFAFPPSWLYVDNVEGEWGAFNDILKRKDSSIQTQVATLQMKIISEDQTVEARSTELLTEWDKTKPVAGNIRPDQALNAIAVIEGKFARLKEDRDNVAKAKEALELIEPGTLVPSEEKVQVALEELQDLKGVWSELAKFWEKIEELKERPWLSVQPRKLRQSLEGLLNDMKALPSRLRQYSSFEFVQNTIKSYLKINVLIVELKSEALKERHWKNLMRRLHVRDVWQGFELDLVNYQNKCRII